MPGVSETVVERARKAFKAFRHQSLEGKQATMRRWFEKMTPEEKTRVSLLLWVMLLKDKASKKSKEEER